MAKYCVELIPKGKKSPSPEELSRVLREVCEREFPDFQVSVSRITPPTVGSVLDTISSLRAADREQVEAAASAAHSRRQRIFTNAVSVPARPGPQTGAVPKASKPKAEKPKERSPPPQKRKEEKSRPVAKHRDSHELQLMEQSRVALSRLRTYRDTVYEWAAKNGKPTPPVKLDFTYVKSNLGAQHEKALKELLDAKNSAEKSLSEYRKALRAGESPANCGTACTCAHVVLSASPPSYRRSLSQLNPPTVAKQASAVSGEKKQ